MGVGVKANNRGERERKRVNEKVSELETERERGLGCVQGAEC